MASPRNVTIIGLGLIGGSLGLALKRHGTGYRVTGLDDPSVLDLALERGAIDFRAPSPARAVAEADLVVLATPIGASLRLLEEISDHVPERCVVTDVGSVKRPVAEQAARVLPAHAEFVGGHPMTGSEKRGISNADALLFENAVYVLCPEQASESAFGRVAEMARSTGARVRVMPSEDHDRAAARVSHLPQLMAVCLVNLIEGDEDSAALAAGGFRDMTRIASSSFHMWGDILAGNKGFILDELGRLAGQLQRLRNRLAEDDLEAAAADFRTAASVRNAIPAGSKGFLNPLRDVFVYTADRPGALLGIVQTLSEAEVDIKDIELLKIREGTGGTFRLGFKDDPAAEKAIRLLSEAGLQTYTL